VADFDAGSIIASMELDRDPYTQGLAMAKKQGAEFEKSKITKRVDADIRPAQDGLEKIAAESDALSSESPTITPKVNSKPAEESLARISAEERAVGKNASDAHEGVGLLVSSIATLAPTVSPLMALLTAGIGGFTSGIAQAAAAIGPFALVAKSDFTDMQASLKAVAAAQQAAFNAKTPAEYQAAIVALQKAQAGLAGPAGVAASAYQHLLAVVKQVKADTAGPVFAVMTAAFNTAARVLPIIEPLIDKTAQAVLSSVNSLNKGLGGPAMAKFLALVEKNVVPDMRELTNLLGNFARGTLALIEDFDPAAQGMLKNVDGLSKSFAHWSATAANGEIKSLLAYVKTSGPEVGHTLLAIAGAVFHLLQALAPLGGPTLLGLRLLSDLIANLPVPVVDALVIALGPLALAIKTVTALQKGWTAAVGAWNSATKVATKVMGLFNISIDAQRIKIAALRAEMLVLRATIWTIQAAQDAWAAAAAVDWIAILGPIALVVAAIALLGLAVYEIIKHWRGLMTFYDWVWRGLKDGFHAVERVAIDVFDFIKKHWMLIGAVLLGPVALAVYEIVKHFKTIEGWVKDLPGLVVTAFKDLASIIFAPWKMAFNLIASAWDDTVGKLSFHLPGWIPGLGGKGFSMPQIPHLAAGGVVNRATTAVVGEDGPEAILPLDKDTVLSKSANAQTRMLAQVRDALHQIHATLLVAPKATAEGVGEKIGRKFEKAQTQAGLAVVIAGRAG